MLPLLLVLMIGQCAGGSCPSPSFRQSFLPSFPQPQYVQQAYRVVQPSSQADQKTYGWHLVKYDGLTVNVWGFPLADGRIEWDQYLRENVSQVDKARIKAASPVVEKRKAVIEPVKPVGDRPINGLNFGLNTDKLASSGVRYTSNSPVEAAALIESEDAPRDKCYLTVIGNKADRDAVKAAYESAAMADIHDKVWFGSYSKGEWQVNDSLGYHAENGKPTVLLQAPSGRVLYRALDFSAGVEPIVAALRKADPNYHPERDPGPGKPKHDDPIITPGRLALAVGALFVLLLLMPRRKQ